MSSLHVGESRKLEIQIRPLILLRGKGVLKVRLNIVLQMTYVSSYDWMTQALRLSFCPGPMLTYSDYNLAYQLILLF